MRTSSSCALGRDSEHVPLLLRLGAIELDAASPSFVVLCDERALAADRNNVDALVGLERTRKNSTGGAVNPD